MNKRLEKDFKEYLAECDKVTSYGGNVVNYRNRCDVYFYEWGDLTSVPKRFNDSEVFFKFLDECKINITAEIKKEFDTRYTFYATCFPNSNVLAVASSKLYLEDVLKRCTDNNNIIPTDRMKFYTYTQYTPTNSGNYLVHGYNPYGDDYDYWD